MYAGGLGPPSSRADSKRGGSIHCIIGAGCPRDSVISRVRSPPEPLTSEASGLPKISRPEVATSN